MIDHIPITFEYLGREYRGELHEVFGAGTTTVWHLMIDNYYRGKLHFLNGEFKFYGNRFEDIADVFGEQIMLWYE